MKKPQLFLFRKYFESQDYIVNSVEKDNLGWDLIATHKHDAKVQLKLEVKGLSGDSIAVELTPNEYQMMRRHKDSYRICIATNCLNEKAQRLVVFAYDQGEWRDEMDRLLKIKKMQSARLSCR